MTPATRITASSAPGRNVSKSHHFQSVLASGQSPSLTLCSSLSRQHRPSAPNTEPVSRRLHLLVPELLPAGGGAGHLGRGPAGVRAAGREPGQHRHELRPGLCGRGGAARQRAGRLDRTQAPGTSWVIRKGHSRMFIVEHMYNNKYCTNVILKLGKQAE